MEINKFTSFIKPFLEFIDSGDFYRRPFSWLYIALAGVNLLFPLFFLYQTISSGIFEYMEGKAIFLFILIFLLLLFACWIGFQIWWNRKDQVTQTSSMGDKFTAIPVFAHFIQTLGEWSGSIIAIAVGGSALLITLFGGSFSDMLPSYIPGHMFVSMGFLGVIIAPIYGFLVIVTARVSAEIIRALASIANNTAK